MPLLRRRRKPAAPKPCTRPTCCTDNPGAEPGPACFHPSACGCRVVPHPAHPTPDLVSMHASASGTSPAAQE